MCWIFYAEGVTIRPLRQNSAANCSWVWAASTKNAKFQPFFRKALIDLE
jgi:hypothetical protein